MCIIGSCGKPRSMEEKIERLGRKEPSEAARGMGTEDWIAGYRVLGLQGSGWAQVPLPV